MVNRTRTDGSTAATASMRSAKSCGPSEYEFTFCPRSVTSLYPRAASASTSETMPAKERLRSRPRVNGTTQNEQNLSHPRMMEIQALTPPVRSGTRSS